MQTKLFLALMALATFLGKNEKIDFGTDKVTSGWFIVNDGVMGGRSQGKIKYTEDALIFEGKLSLENNGGFASIRTAWGEYDLSRFDTVSMRIKGDGRSYGFVLSTDSQFYLPNYKHEFTGIPEKWTTIHLPIRSFHQEVMGRKTGKMVSETNLSEVIRMGIILSDKIEGPFKLEVDYLAFR